MLCLGRKLYTDDSNSSGGCQDTTPGLENSNVAIFCDNKTVENYRVQTILYEAEVGKNSTGWRPRMEDLIE